MEGNGTGSSVNSIEDSGDSATTISVTESWGAWVCRGLGNSVKAVTVTISEGFFFGLSNSPSAGLGAIKIYQGAGHTDFNPCTGLPQNPINFTEAGVGGWIVGVTNVADCVYSVLSVGSIFAGKPPVHKPDMASPYVVKYQWLKPASETTALVVRDEADTPKDTKAGGVETDTVTPISCCTWLDAFSVYRACCTVAI